MGIKSKVNITVNVEEGPTIQAISKVDSGEYNRSLIHLKGLKVAELIWNFEEKLATHLSLGKFITFLSF